MLSEWLAQRRLRVSCRDGQWNKGWQPWCRSRSLENTLRIVSIVFGILLSIAFLAMLFLCCFCFSKARREKNEKYNTGEPLPKKPLSDVPEPSTMVVTANPIGKPNGYTMYNENVRAPPYKSPEEYKADLRVQVVDDVSQNSSPGSGRGNVTSV